MCPDVEVYSQTCEMIRHSMDRGSDFIIAFMTFNGVALAALGATAAVTSWERIWALRIGIAVVGIVFTIFTYSAVMDEAELVRQLAASAAPFEQRTLGGTSSLTRGPASLVGNAVDEVYGDPFVWWAIVPVFFWFVLAIVFCVRRKRPKPSQRTT